MTSILHYVHDPMCSWCWGFKPAFDSLLTQLPPSIAVNRVLGGLAPDSNEPMASGMQQRLQQTWQQISVVVPGTEFNFDFWTKNQARRSTFPACRAVLAAKKQNADFEVAMIDAIQRAYYLQAKNPSDTDVLISLADSIGCDVQQFSGDLLNKTQQELLDQNMNFAHQLGVHGFPSLVFQFSETQASPVGINYTEVSPMLEQIEHLHVA